MVASEETGRSRAIRIERDAILAQDWEKVPFSASNNEIVLALVNSGLDKAVFLTDVHKSLDFLGGVIGETPMLDLALPLSLIHGFASLLELSGTIWHVQILNVDLFDF
jgi:hypothetical protein